MSKNKVTFNLPPLGKEHAKKAVKKQEQVIQNPVTKDIATEQITKVIVESGIPPKMYVTMGELAERAIREPKEYKKFVDFMVDKGLESRDDLKKPDYQMLASIAVIGKVAQTMPDKMDQILPKGSVSGPVSPEQGL